MKYHLGIEDIEPGNWVAWVFELPGCYARGATREEAVERAPAAVSELLKRSKGAGYPVPDDSTPPEIEISEEYRSFKCPPDYIVNAFFEDDKRPLTDADIAYAFPVLNLNRETLLAAVSSLPDSTLYREIPGEVQKNVAGILRHIGTAEWWYWDRLKLAFPREERPPELFELLEKVRNFTMKQLPGLTGSRQSAVCSEEQWSPRKLLRRAIWHEHVHTRQIIRYLGKSCC
ncbi:conserved hypothetical protein [Candidatus Zixiibacteriota bacterium]|nr:conserved hypothetical protein [candidate division Zixibacteria bacterium]